MRNNIAGIKICTTMLMALAVVMAGGCSILDKFENRWKFDREEVAGLIVDKDADGLYELLAPNMLEETDLTEDDLQEFLDKCDIGNTSSKDMERYTEYKFLGDPSDPEGNHYRPGLICAETILCTAILIVVSTLGKWIFLSTTKSV